MTPDEGTAVLLSGGTLAGYALSGIVSLLLPAAAFLWLRYYRAARIYPVIAGIIVYFVAVQMSNLFGNIIGFSASFAQRTVLAAELVCYFEECGRWLAMRWPVTDIRDTRSAICYGIGHAGLECWIRGAQQLHICHLGQQVNRGGIEQFFGSRTPEQIDLFTQQMQIYADHSLFLSLLTVLNSLTNFGFHIAVSLLICRKIQETNGQKRWLLCAVLLHTALNGSVWLASFSGSEILKLCIGILCGICVIIFVNRMIGISDCFDEIRYRMVPEETA